MVVLKVILVMMKDPTILVVLQEVSSEMGLAQRVCCAQRHQKQPAGTLNVLHIFLTLASTCLAG